MISVILYGRNDAHGYNLHRRAALSLNCIAEVLTDPDDEIIFVDYNTPDELPTLIEAISDTLTERCLELLRVLRVPAEIHAQRFACRSHLPVIEPVARNAAARRANPSNRWLLSTNTDMVFLAPSGESLSEVCSRLPDGFYGLPRFELPEWLWERLPRADPRRALAELEHLGPGLRLDEPTLGHEWVRFDAPGDFQLILREDFFSIKGFDENMLHGYHVDSNMSRRLLLHRGSIETLEQHVAGYHCNHNRTRTIYHGSQVENDLVRFFYSVNEPELRGQPGDWGLADVTLPEVLVRKRVNMQSTAAVVEAIPTGPRMTSDARDVAFALTYDSGHILPFIADAVIVSTPDVTFGYLGANAILRRMLGDLVQSLGLDHSLVVARFDDTASIDELAHCTDVVVVDLGLDASQFDDSLQPFDATVPPRFPAAFEHALDALDRLVALERDRFEKRKHPRRIVLVNGSAVFWQAYVLAQFDCSYTTPHSRVRRAAIKPVADPVATRTALVRGRRLIRWSMRGEPGENGLRLRPGQILTIADLDSYHGFDNGWAQPEDAGIWTEGPRSNVEVALAGIDESEYALTFSLGPVCATPDNSLDVDLLLNGDRVAAQSFTQDSAGLPWRVDLSSHKLVDGSADLTFVVAEPRTPLALGFSPDNRPLGIFVRTMQLEQLDRSVRLGEGVIFSEGSRATGMLGEGWSGVEASGVWTVGKRAQLLLELIDVAGSDLELVLAVAPLVAPGHPELEVHVSAAGERLATRIFSYGEADHSFQVQLPASLIGEPGLLALDLRLRDPVRPVDLGINEDARRLALHLRSLTIRRPGTGATQDARSDALRKVRLGEEVVFSEEPRASGMLGEGWSAVEASGVWTVGERARLLLELGDVAGSDLELVLGVAPLVAPNHPQLEVRVSASGERLATRIFSYGEADHSFQVRLPASLTDQSELLALDLRLRDPVRPVDLGINEDARRLGLHLRSLTIRRPGTGATQVSGLNRLRKVWNKFL